MKGSSDKVPQCSFTNSLLLQILLGISKEIHEEDNTWYAGEHFRNDPRQNPGERLLHYIRTDATTNFVQKFKNKHHELIYKPDSLPTQEENVA